MNQIAIIEHDTALPAIGPSLEDCAHAADDYVRASSSAGTRRAYAKDARLFVAWCDRHGLAALPADVDTVSSYLASLARAGLKSSTISRRAAAIRFIHRKSGLEPPTNAESCKSVLQGIRRELGTAHEQKAPATAEVVRAMLEEIPDNVRGLRDHALLVLGFAAALRRSEIVALDVADLEETPEGLHVHIRRSKTDQEGAGYSIFVKEGVVLRPMAAIRAWLDAAGITEGAAFRPVIKGGAVAPGRLTDRSVAQIVKDRAAAAGLDASRFSGHSLRAGFVTSALSAGGDMFKVMDTTRHKEVRTLRAYDRRAKGFDNYVGALFM